MCVRAGLCVLGCVLCVLCLVAPPTKPTKPCATPAYDYSQSHALIHVNELMSTIPCVVWYVYYTRAHVLHVYKRINTYVGWCNITHFLMSSFPLLAQTL